MNWVALMCDVFISSTRMAPEVALIAQQLMEVEDAQFNSIFPIFALVVHHSELQ